MDFNRRPRGARRDRAGAEIVRISYGKLFTRREVGSARRADFDLTVADARLEARLRERRGAAFDAAVFNREGGAVPRTLDDLAIELAFGERPAHVRACVRDGVNFAAASHEQDWHAFGLDLPHLTFAQLAFGEHGDELFRHLLGRAVIDADLLPENEVT